MRRQRSRIIRTECLASRQRVGLHACEATSILSNRTAIDEQRATIGPAAAMKVVVHITATGFRDSSDCCVPIATVRCDRFAGAAAGTIARHCARGDLIGDKTAKPCPPPAGEVGQPAYAGPALADLPKPSQVVSDPPAVVVQPNYMVVTHLGTLLDLLA